MESMISQLNQFQSYSLNTQQQSSVIGGKYSIAYRAFYETEDGSHLVGYLAKDSKDGEWVFIHREGDEIKTICITGIDPDF